jgi:hypothetical protein
MRFQLVVKNGQDTLATVEGHQKSGADITVDDLKKLIEVEQFLERMFGHRFHILETH